MANFRTNIDIDIEKHVTKELQRMFKTIDIENLRKIVDAQQMMRGELLRLAGTFQRAKHVHYQIDSTYKYIDRIGKILNSLSQERVYPSKFRFRIDLTDRIQPVLKKVERVRHRCSNPDADGSSTRLAPKSASTRRGGRGSNPACPH